jgi:phage baseplate assembly protein V
MNLDFSVLFRRIEDLQRQINNHARQINNIFREGKVVEVYPEEGVAVVEMYGEGSKTKKIPWLSQSGGIKDFVPPSVGQRVVMFSPGGESGKAVIMPGGYSDQFPQPHNKGDEAKRTIGDSSDLMTGESRLINAKTIELTAGGGGHLK